MLTVEVVQYCNVLNDVFFERKVNISQSTIYLSILDARSFPIPGSGWPMLMGFNVKKNQ